MPLGIDPALRPRTKRRTRRRSGPAQKIAMRRGRVMVISCPTPAIGVFPEDF
jgi:hypothetical protein